MELEPEWTLPFPLKSGQKVQHKYGAGPGVTPHNQLRLERDGTGVGATVNPPPLHLNSHQKVQHKYGSDAGSRSGVNPYLQSAEVRQSWSWNEPPTTTIS